MRSLVAVEDDEDEDASVAARGWTVATTAGNQLVIKSNPNMVTLHSCTGVIVNILLIRIQLL